MNASLTAADLETLARFPKLLRQLNDVLAESAYEKFCRLIDEEPEEDFDPTDAEYNFAYYQVTNDGVYYEFGFWNRNGKLFCGAQVSVAPEADDEIRLAFEEGMKQVNQTNPGWNLTEEEIADELDVIQLRLYRKARPLNDFLANPQPFAAISAYIGSVLDELLALQEAYPSIPWR